MSIEVMGNLVRYDTRAKERTLYKIIDQKDQIIREKDEEIELLKQELDTKTARVEELLPILKKAKKKTRSRKIWKLKAVEDI